MLDTFFNYLPLSWHIVCGFLARLLLILFGDHQEKNSDGLFTDLDYGLHIDSAKLVLNLESPYKKHIYPHSPIMSYVMIPNVLYDHMYGKIFFCVCDLLIGLIIREIVWNQLKSGRPKVVNNIANVCCITWIYNPLGIAVTSRGSSDSLHGMMIVLSIYYLEKNGEDNSQRCCIMSGIFLGLASHLRLYPIWFLLPIYLSLGNKPTWHVWYSIITNLLRDPKPNKYQTALIGGWASTFFGLGFIFYCMYGYNFISDTYFFNVIRKDMKPTFSLLYYLIYVGSDMWFFEVILLVFFSIKVFMMVAVSVAFGFDPETLPFAVFCQNVVMVIYQDTMTSQHLMWILTLFPIIMHNLALPRWYIIILGIGWSAVNSFWLTYAFQFEFGNKDVLLFIGYAAICFFLANAYVFSVIIKYYTPRFAFGQQLYGRVD